MNPPHLSSLTQHLAGLSASYALFSFPCLFCPNCCCPLCTSHALPPDLSTSHLPMPPLCPGGVTLLEPAFDLDLVFLEICRNSHCSQNIVRSSLTRLAPACFSVLGTLPASMLLSPSFHFTLPPCVCPAPFPAPPLTPFSYCQTPKRPHIFHAMLPLPVTILPHVACAQPPTGVRSLPLWASQPWGLRDCEHRLFPW